MNAKGHALHEYAIALGLLAVVAIGALQLLGWNINNLFASTTSSKTTSETEKLFSLIGASTGQKSGKAPLQASVIPQNVSLKIDPVTGKVMITDNSGGEKNSTSVDGGTLIEGAAQALAKLQNMTLSNGQPLPDDIKALLQKLSAQGGQIGQFYSQFETSQDAINQLNQAISKQTAQGQFTGPPYYSPDLVSEAIGYTDQYIQFSQTYQQLQTKLTALAKTDPAAASIQKSMNDYAGAITNTAHENMGQPLFSALHIDRAQDSDLAAALKNNPTANQYFQLLNTQTANMSPAERETYFQQTILTIGEQLKVGTPITSSDLSISLVTP